uniref:Uncharacterized protein n=1 Tax=Knipowitschia caucasica TaxID=637954 RepID=A0AAV2JZP2_KNICA
MLHSPHNPSDKERSLPLPFLLHTHTTVSSNTNPAPSSDTVFAKDVARIPRSSCYTLPHSAVVPYARADMTDSYTTHHTPQITLCRAAVHVKRPTSRTSPQVQIAPSQHRCPLDLVVSSPPSHYFLQPEFDD